MKLRSIYSIASVVLLASIMGLNACNKSQEDYHVEKVIEDQVKRDSILLDIVTVIEEHLDTIPKPDRFKPANRPYFKYRAEKYNFIYLYKNEKGEYFYYVTKPAYGVPDLSVGLAGKFKLDEQDHLTNFEESYRLFRMKPEDLDKKGWEVYQDFVQEKDLTVYHKDLNVDPYIEFPNEHVGYDKKKLEWYIIKPY